MAIIGGDEMDKWTFEQLGEAIDAIWPGDAACYNDEICRAYIENAESIFSDGGWTLAEYSAEISNRLAKSVAMARERRYGPDNEIDGENCGKIPAA